MLQDPWSVSELNFPSKGADREKLLFLLNYAVLAPSGHNTQPWRFKLGKDHVALYADRTRALQVIDPNDRELVMSCGAALFHLETAIRHFYLTPIVRTFPDTSNLDLLAILSLGSASEEIKEIHNLFRAIKNRRTNRLAFKRRQIPVRDLEALQLAADIEGVDLRVITDVEEKEKLADLIAEGDRIQGANRSFRRELASWIHPNRVQQKDGLPGYALGAQEIESMVVPFLVRTFDWGDGQAAKDRQLAEGSPALVVLSTDEDSEERWFLAGQVLDHVLLLGTHFGISASFLNQPLEIAELRAQVAETVGVAGYPQIILRMGYGPQPERTPRRPLHEVLTMD